MTFAMSRLTKDQIEKLTPEQQEAYASSLASDFRRRHELMELARQRWTYRVAAGLLFAASVGMAILVNQKPFAPFCIILLAVLIQIHATVLNQRLDALVELLDTEFGSSSERQERA